MGCVTTVVVSESSGTSHDKTYTRQVSYSEASHKEKSCASYLYLPHVRTVNSPGVAKALNVKISADNKAFGLR